jgi:hypothetical protein
MDFMWVGAIMGSLTVGSIAFAFAAPHLGRSARLKRRARKSPIRRVCEARRDELIRVRGIVRELESPLALPFSSQPGVYHWTQLTDYSNPGQTKAWTKCARVRSFIVDDGSGQARISDQGKLVLLADEEGGGMHRDHPSVVAFLNGNTDAIFSRGASVVWRQRAIRIGDEVLAWGRAVHEPANDTGASRRNYRETPLRIVLLPPRPRDCVVIEKL